MSGSAIGFNLGLALVAGPGPFAAPRIASGTGSSVMPALYMAIVAAVATAFLLRYLPETTRRNLVEEAGGEGVGRVAEQAGSLGRTG